jgi:hypothetical protein
MCARRYPRRCRFHMNQTDSYRAARQHDEARLEYETRLFPGDVRLWKESNRMITFKRWLTDGRAA